MVTQPNPDLAEQVKLAAQVFIYGYPLVYSLNEMSRFPRGTATLYPGRTLPYNTFGYIRDLIGPDAHFVSPNNDTLYLLMIGDVRNGPLVLHVPDTQDRYYVLQFADAWSNNFAYVGRRATGTQEASYLIAEHGYSGPVPVGMKVIHAPSGVFILVGRIAVNGEADLPAAHALQDQFTVTPLSVYQGGAAPAAAPGLPKADPGVPDDLKWWEKLRVALAAFPPPPADAPFLAICEKFGLTKAESTYIDAPAELEQVLMLGQKAAEDKIEELIKTSIKRVNGWQNTIHVFDYNLDYFEIGTLNSPQWIVAERKMAYILRAVAARAGLWGNHGYEANYQLVYIDAEDKLLDSANRYELHLPVPPPVDAFWSLTMYDASEFYLVANPINRYSIGDRTPGLKYNADGSLTIYMQKDSPGADKESNWLPTPQAGNFRPVMRMYQPQEPILDGSYLLPAIQRVG
jgi:hypothetical protein